MSEIVSLYMTVECDSRNRSTNQPTDQHLNYTFNVVDGAAVAVVASASFLFVNHFENETKKHFNQNGCCGV